MLDDRKLDVLRAIVEDYVATQEPVGSKALVERHQLGVSPATVRNDMAALEEEGFITQPHTSAGRIPTDKGYRLFVDKLTSIKPLTRRREARDRHLPAGGGRPRRRGAPQRPAARPAHPAGRDRPVPDAGPLDGAPRRGGHAVGHPVAARADHQHRAGRAARRRAVQGTRGRRHRRPPCTPQHRRRRAAPVRCGRPGGLAAGACSTPTTCRWSRRSSRSSPRPSPTTARTRRSRSAAPPT